MADAYTDFLNLTKPEVGGSRDAWGNKWNANADAISVWAKATDALVKRAVLRDPASNAGQSIAGPLSLSAGYDFTSGLHIRTPKNGRFIAGAGSHFFESTNADGSTYATDIRAGTTNVFRVVNYAENFEILRADPAAGLLAFSGATVWHSSNFTPANYANRTTTAGNSFAGPIALSFASPYIDLIYPNVMRLRQVVDANGTWVLQNGDNGDSKFYVTTAGAVWTKQFGDLNARIETRAQAFADDRLATARSEYGQAFQKTGGPITGDVTIQKATPRLWFFWSGVKRASWVLDGGGNFIWQDESGQNHFFINPSGAVWTQQFGDLNTRIEARAQAFADDRLATARGEYGQKVAKGGDVMSGDLQITKNYPTFRMLYPSVRDLGWQVRDDGKTYLWDFTGNTWLVNFGIDGSISTKQFGDVNSRIEARAQAFADDRLTTATARINNKSARLAFSQDIVIGDTAASSTWEGVGGGVLTGFQQNGSTGQARAFRVRQLQMSDSNGAWYACGYV